VSVIAPAPPGNFGGHTMAQEQSPGTDAAVKMVQVNANCTPDEAIRIKAGFAKYLSKYGPDDPIGGGKRTWNRYYAAMMIVGLPK